QEGAGAGPGHDLRRVQAAAGGSGIAHRHRRPQRARSLRHPGRQGREVRHLPRPRGGGRPPPRPGRRHRQGRAAAGCEAVVVDDRYTIVSADGHAGGDIQDYRPYLPSTWHDEFDAWANSYVNPFADLLAATAYRNFDSERRLAETSSDGIVAEVL